jgi:hypothetical protein
VRKDPAGVVILGVLAIVWGIFGLCGSGLLLLSGRFLARRAALRIEALVASLAMVILIVIVTVVMLIQFMIYILFGIGALRLSPWAWTLGVVLALVGLIVRIASLVLDQRLVTIGGDIIRHRRRRDRPVLSLPPQVRQAFGQST